ncbi:Ubiquitin-associated protein 1-like [Merluccius polli]|uniref:Ubiquitin-associated protein 1-like n=1 Tax=Merluccius polli TaxID=89951 RepID=A0AA47MBC5_MERPO|nr:Ubiquitin-associated protein 1-like [Merluccius polli]
MSGLEGVPLKTPLWPFQEELGSVSPPEITLPDYLSILQDTQYEFSLENWVLTGLDGGVLRPPRPPAPRCSAGAAPPSSPPYWLLFSSPQQSRLASRCRSDFWEPDPRPRSNSLNPADLRSRPALAICGWDDGDGGGGAPVERAETRGALPATPPAPPPPREGPPPPREGPPPPREGPSGTAAGTESAPPPPHRSRYTAPHSVHPPVRFTPVVWQSVAHSPRSPSGGPLRAALKGSDSSWAELLSALSGEERTLLSAITDRGYPLRTALMALQRTGRRPPDQVRIQTTRPGDSSWIFSYLGACDHLCELGYDEAQVQEALEMFHNSETKAEEFLNLLNQFNEMGFQQSAIKEVLLVHDNHRERALEELMTHVA